jgi:hypothetical protein
LKYIDTYTVSGKLEHLCTVLKHCNIYTIHRHFIIKIRDPRKNEIAQSRIGDKNRYPGKHCSPKKCQELNEDVRPLFHKKTSETTYYKKG